MRVQLLCRARLHSWSDWAQCKLVQFPAEFRVCWRCDAIRIRRTGPPAPPVPKDLRHLLDSWLSPE